MVQAVRTALKTLLTLTDGQVVVVHGPGLRPAGAHIGVQLVSQQPVSGTGKMGAAGAYTTSVQYRATLLLTAYGAAAVEWLGVVSADWLTKKAALATMRAAGFFTESVSPVTDLSTDVDGEWEPRRGLTVTGNHRVVRPVATLPYISEVEFDLDLQPGSVPVAGSSTEADT